MKLSIRALSLSLAIVWGGVCLLVAIANALWPPYGQEFLSWVASFYPGYQLKPDVANIVVLTAYAIVDGFICGAIFAMIYNALLPSPKAEKSKDKAAESSS